MASDATLPDFDKFWIYGKPDESEEAFQKHLPAAQASGNLDYLLQL
jgi:hypothetical protein